MTRMRHPAPDVTGEINIPDEAVSMHRMSGWLTDDEWTRAGYPEPPVPEPEPDEDEPQDEAPGEPGEQETKRPRRPRPRATSEGNED